MIYTCYDLESGSIVSTFYNVAESQRLTGGQVSDGDAELTVASTAQVFPGMRLVGKGIPANTLVLSVDSDTTLTMTAPATTDAEGLFIQAHAYIDVSVVRAINIEHYRDLFGGSTSYGIVPPADGSVTPGTAQMEGAGVYLTAPEAGSITNGGGVSGVLKGALNATQDDRLTHTAPREQVRKVTTHFLICQDGTVLPVAVMPLMHLAQAGS